MRKFRNLVAGLLILTGCTPPPADTLLKIEATGLPRSSGGRAGVSNDVPLDATGEIPKSLGPGAAVEEMLRRDRQVQTIEGIVHLFRSNWISLTEVPETEFAVTSEGLVQKPGLPHTVLATNASTQVVIGDFLEFSGMEQNSQVKHTSRLQQVRERLDRLQLEAEATQAELETYMRDNLANDPTIRATNSPVKGRRSKTHSIVEPKTPTKP